MVYPQGNYIRPADSKPYLVIGEVKYGKPILDRVITPNVSIGDASRCALISMDSTLKSDLTVGPPIDIAVYNIDIDININVDKRHEEYSLIYCLIISQTQENLRELNKNPAKPHLGGACAG